MALDPQYLDAIRGLEGYSPQASWDYKQFSSGYGTRAQPGDEYIPPDQLKGIHEQRFAEEIGKAEKSVDDFSQNLPPGVRAALSSLTYNAGPGWQNAGLGDAIKAGDWDKAKGIFLQYNKAGGEVSPGLVSRRQREAAWFGDAPPPPPAPSGPLVLPSAQMPNLPAQAAPPPQPAAQFTPSAPLQLPMEQIQPINIRYAPRRQIDLSSLRAALQRRG